MRYTGARTPTGETLAATIYVYQCFEHGPFHLGREMPLRAGG
jgi:hypothetical protein